MPVEVRRLRVDDWRAMRALRLEALEDTPMGFLETLEEALQKPDEEWIARAARRGEGGEGFQVMAWDGDRPVGNCACFLRDGSAWLAAVYVTPDHRGQRLLDQLVEPCAVWGREQGCSVLRLEVHEDNARAQVAYVRLGFRDTGERAPYPLPPGGQELVMERPL